jgi:hypothetical protein
MRRMAASYRSARYRMAATSAAPSFSAMGRSQSAVEFVTRNAVPSGTSKEVRARRSQVVGSGTSSTASTWKSRRGIVTLSVMPTRTIRTSVRMRSRACDPVSR